MFRYRICPQIFKSVKHAVFGLEKYVPQYPSNQELPKTVFFSLASLVHAGRPVQSFVLPLHPQWLPPGQFEGA